MKALVLCGGLPQIYLMEELKRRNITVVLADMNEKVIGRSYADIFYPVSVLDVDAVRKVAVEEKVDFLITVCADQVLQVVAQIAEELELPWYIDYATAENVSKKSYMKRIFWENGIPTSQYVIQEELDEKKLTHLQWPLIVKPVDSYSSRGVKKVSTREELLMAFAEAKKISRTATVVVEEFVEGNEMSVDVYVEEGTAHVLSVGRLDKIPGNDGFVIHRATYPPVLSDAVMEQIRQTAQKIAKAFGLKNTPMLIQLITDGKLIRVVEFCARTGGGIKFRLIKERSGFDVVKAVVDLTLGEKPHVQPLPENIPHQINQFLYCKEGVFDHLEGFEELLQEGVICAYNQLKSTGTAFGQIRSSGDRVAYFTVKAENAEALAEKYRIACSRIRVLDDGGADMLRRDILELE